MAWNYYGGNKYNNVKTEINGQRFDSKLEARRYIELLQLENAGVISDLRTQVEFELIPAQYEQVGNKKKCIERKCIYKADFVYIEDGAEVVEDTKSKATKTKEYIIKRKLMLYKYGIKIKEIYK